MLIGKKLEEFWITVVFKPSEVVKTDIPTVAIVGVVAGEPV